MAASFGEKLLAEVYEESLDEVRIFRYTYLAWCMQLEALTQC